MSSRAVALLIAILGAILISACGGGGETTVTVTVGDESAGGAEVESAEEQAEAPRGGVGDTLTLFDDYEQDGVAIDEKVAFTLVEVSEDAKPNGNSYSARAELPAGYRYLRLKVSVSQEGETENGGITSSQFTALDADDQQYEAASGEIFAPQLIADGSLKLPPGETRTGYVAIAVPDDAEITQVEVKDSGFVPPNTAIWELR